MKEQRMHVVEMMTQNCDLDNDKRMWRRSKPAARMAIMEHRVLLNGAKVTHTEVAVPVGKEYEILVWDHKENGYDVLRVNV